MEATNPMTSLNPSQEFTRRGVKQIFIPRRYGLPNYGISARIKEAYPKAEGEGGFPEIRKDGCLSQPPLLVTLHRRAIMWQEYHLYTIIRPRMSSKMKGKGNLDQTRDRTVNPRVYDQEKGDLAKSGNSTAVNITHAVEGLI